MTSLPSPRRSRFTRAMRMRSGSDFERAYREGSRARGAVLIVVARPNGAPSSRLGLSVGRRIWKSAVRRNRVRRVFRESFRLEFSELPEGFDFVLIPAERQLTPALAATRRELKKLAHKAARRALEKRAGKKAPKERA